MAKKVERAHRAANGGRPCGCSECVATRKKRGEPETVYVLHSASIAAQRYEVLHGTEVYTADRRCMVASCDGGHLDRVQSLEMAQRIARLLTADETEQAHARHARRTGKTLTKIAGAGPSEDYVLAVEELKRAVEHVEGLLRTESDKPNLAEPYDEYWRCAERLRSALAAFSKVDPNAKG